MVVVKHTFHAFEVHAQKTRSFITRIVHSMERIFLLYLILERLVCQLFLQGQATHAHCPFQLVMSDLEGVKWEMAEIHGGWLRGTSDMPSGKDWHPLGSGQIDRMMQNRHHRIWVPSDFGGMWEVQMVDSWIDRQTKVICAMLMNASWVSLAGSNCWALLAVWGLCGIVWFVWFHAPRFFRWAHSETICVFFVACKPDPHLSFSVLMRRLDGKLHHVLGESRYHSFVSLGKGKPIHPGKKVECTKKHHITKRLITKTPQELVR